MPVMYGGLCAGDDRLETDGGELVFAGDGTGFLELREAILNRLGIIGHALEAALV